MISVILLLILMAMIYMDHRKVMRELKAIRDQTAPVETRSQYGIIVEGTTN